MALYRGGGSRFFILLVIYTISILLAISPLGEKLLRLFERARKIETSREKELLIPLFDEVYEKAKKDNPDLGKIDLFIIDKLAVNACAIGKHTIAVTKGAIEFFTEDELKAIIAHEIAHIINFDTVARLFLTIGNGFFTIILLTLKVCRYVIEWFQYILEASKPLKAVVSVVGFIMEGILTVIMLLIQMAVSVNSRKNELRADKFVHDLGYGEEMIDALYLLEKFNLGDDSTNIQKMIADHPRISLRIEKLETLIENENVMIAQ